MKDFLNDKPCLGNTAHIYHPLATMHEIAAQIRVSCDLEGGDGPVIYVHNPHKGGLGYTMPVVGSVFGSMDRVYAAAGALDRIGAIKNVIDAASYACAGSLGDPEIDLHTTSSSNRTLQKTELTLDDLPICTYNEHDCGPFITAGVQVVKANGCHQLGIHRMKKIEGRNALGCLAPPNRRVGEPFYEAEKTGESIPMVVLVGAPPPVVVASQIKIPFDRSKYDCAISLDDSIGFTEIDGFMVPSTTEIVLVGRSVPGERIDDTPFSEYTGTMCFKSDTWVFEVESIYTQPKPVFQALLTGRNPQEDSNLCRLAISAEIYKMASSIMEVTDVDIVGNGVFSALVCVKKNRLDEEVRNLIYTLLGNRYIKSVAVMDHDLSATDADFRFAFDSRYQPDLDTTITPHLLGASLDPSTPKFQTTSKIGFDLTFPIGKFKAHGRARVPGEEYSKSGAKNLWQIK